MIEAAYANAIGLYTGFMGLLFMIAAAYTYYRLSWALLFSGHFVMFVYSILNSSVSINYYSLFICICCLIGFKYYDEEIEIESTKYTITYFAVCLLLSQILVFYDISFINSFTILTTCVGIILLSLKLISGWYFLFTASLLNIQEDIMTSIIAIGIGIVVCIYGYYRWEKEYEEFNINIHTTDGT